MEERRSSWEKLAAFAAPLKTTLKELRTTYGEEGTAQAIDGVLELLIEGATGASVSLDFVAPGLATLLKLGWRGLKASNERALNQDDLRMTIDQGERVRGQHQSRSVELAQALAGFTHASFPVVVAVEDIHLMGDDFSKFLSTLVARKERRIMVVATTWPERNAEDPLSQWLEDAEEADTAVRIAVPNLDEEDLVLLVKSHAPNTTDDVARAVATQLPNPHYVKLWLTVPSIQRQIQLHGDAVVLGDSGLTVPHDIHEILRLRWRSLESHIQQALCLAVAINPIEDPLCSFVPGVLEDLAASSAFLNSEEISEGAVRAVDPAQWCRLSEGVEAFTETLLAEHCRDEIAQQFATEEVERFKAQLRGITSRRIKNEAGDGISMPLVPRALNLALWQRRLQTSGNTSLEDVIALSTLARFAHQQYDFRTAIAHLTDAIDVAEQLAECDPLQLLELRGLHAMFLGDSGKPYEAAEILQQILPEKSKAHGPDHPDTLVARGDLARWVGEAGRVEEAIGRFETLLEDRQRVLGVDHPDTLATRNNLASLLARVGRVEEAIGRFEALLVDLQRILGPDHPHTLTTRGNLASWVGEAGRVDEAIGRFEALLVDRQRILGADHPDTLT
ncbi:tetratricopeptide repeat protein, partial [Schaalia cardiffensis]|uniref:tetratricopeptide repeat protein n=1 Tax=Schaalia cardiffensis TaxID=181487 RepID=UPI0023F28722